jgi:formate/nitrite transporter
MPAPQPACAKELAMNDTHVSDTPHAPFTPYEPVLSRHEFAERVAALGRQKATSKPWELFLLAILAGLYISLGGLIYLVAIEQGMGRVAGGFVFSVGLVLVVVAGAELFTGNIIMLVGVVTGQFPLRGLARNWATVYAGNFAGSLICAWLVWRAGLLGAPGALNRLGELAVDAAGYKVALPFMACLIRGVFCNMLVILAIIMATMAKDVISKVVCCMLPIMLFVAVGFEHCVANMFLIPLGLWAEGRALWQQGVMFRNIVPVTLGNILGGVVILFMHPARLRQLAKLVRPS